MDKKTAAIISMDEQYGAHHYNRIPVSIERAEGCYLYDVTGRKYIDCLAAYSSANLGHHHKAVVKAMSRALFGGYASVISNVVHTSVLSRFLGRVAKLVPPLSPSYPQNKVLPKNGGVESVETAIKAMRYHGWANKNIRDGKQEIIVFDNSFHGRTTTVVSASSTDKYSKGFGGKSPLFKSVPYGNIEAVIRAVTPNTCGVLVEPMQGEGGIFAPPENFLSDLRDLCTSANLMLVFDEIQVGLGRTGKLFCFEHYGVRPDGLILGKAISGGLVPLSVFVTSSHVMDQTFGPGSDGSTYGGYKLACVAGLAAIDTMEKEDIVSRAEKAGNYLKPMLEDIASSRPDVVKEVRGKGLFLGMELTNGNAMEICRKLPDLGVIANDSHGHTIRISPPLIIKDKEMDKIANALDKVL